MEWFVIKGRDHLGPFAEDNVRDLFQSGEIDSQSMLWREGLTDPVTYESVFMTEDDKSFKPMIEDEDVPPPLPPQLERPSETPPKKMEAKRVEKSIEEPPKPEIRPKQVQEVIKEEPQAVVNNTSVESNEENNDGIEEEVETSETKRSWGAIIVISIVLLTIIVSVPVVMYQQQHQSFNRPAKMGLSDYKRLKKLADNNKSSNQFDFALAQDKSELWLATNNPNVGTVSIKLKAIKDKYLGEEEVIAYASGKLNKKLAKFSSFEFKKGVRLVDGYYEIEVYTPKPLEKPFFTQFSGEHKDQFQFFQEILISSMTREDFNRTLAKFIKKKKSNELKFWAELKQKYQTLKMITLQIQEGVRSVFDGDRKNFRPNVKKFENEYKTKFGNFFTSFVIANDKSYESLETQNFPDKVDIIANYTRLSKLAKSIGIHSMNILHEMEGYQSTAGDDEAFKNLERSSLSRLQGIINICDSKMSVIQVE
jgi:hypothetical protein